MKNIYRIILSILAFASLPTYFAEDLFTVDRNYTHYTVEDGLPENSVRCLEEDMYGVVWICTNSGLARFDGYEIRTVIDDHLGDKINSPKVRDLLFFDKYLYIGTEGGLFRLELSTGQISEINLSSTYSKEIYSLEQGLDHIIIGTSKGVYKYTPSDGVELLIDTSLIRKTLSTADGIYISSIGEGVYYYEYFEGKYTKRYTYETKTPVLDIYKIKNRVMFATHGDGLHITDTKLNLINKLKTCSSEKCVPSNYITYFEIFNDQLYVSTRRGIAVLNESMEILDTHQFSKVIKNKYISNSASSLLITKDNVWVGLMPGGLIKLRRNINGVKVYTKRKNYYDEHDSIFSVTSHNKKIYVGTYNGLYEIKNNILHRIKIDNDFITEGSKRISSLCSIDYNKLLLGTADGAYIFNIDDESITKFNTEYPDSQVNSIFCGENTIYIAQVDTVSLLSIDGNNTNINLNGFNFKFITYFYIDKNILYLGTHNGLHVFNIEDTDKPILLEHYLQGEQIYKILKADKTILIITVNGIFEYSDDAIFTSDYKLPNELKYLRFYDAQLINTHLWLTTNNGILKLGKSTYEHYITAHGLGDTEYNLRSSFLDRDSNTFYAGGLNNVTAIDIDTFENINWPNPSVLSKVMVYDSVGKLKQNIYGHPANLIVDEGDSIVFELGHLDSIARSSANFFYTVNKRFSDSKVYLSPKERSISFANITNDDFELTISNSDEILTVSVIPHLWKRWWAYLVYGIILLALLVLWRNYRERVRHTRQAEIIARRELNAKRNQLASLSHELRTPLNSILGTLEGATSLDKDTKYISSSAYLLRSLIDNMLNNIAMDVNNGLVVNRSRFSFENLITECLEIMQPYLTHANITIGFKINSEFPAWIKTDRTKLQQVILNLIKNSIKHGITTTYIDLIASRNDKMLSIQLMDNGCGVPESQQDLLFDAFSRGDEHTSGFGLGLYISKVICTELNGNLWFDSAYNKGACFNIELPLDISSEQPVKVESQSDETLIPVKSLLIFEDDPLNIHALKLLATKAGIEEFIIVSDLDAFEAKIKGGIDVVILDLNLGIKQNGIDLARELKAANYNGDVYMLSAETDPEIKAEALKYVNDYLTKPISISDLQRITSID